MRCLDLFCGGGGAAIGLMEAGFDVIGVDLVPSPRYPAPLIQGDALKPPVDLQAFDLIWTSPPCQLFSFATNAKYRDNHVDLLTPTRELLDEAGVPYVIENVPNAPMRPDLVLTGPMVGLHRIQRRRHFELSWRKDGEHFELQPPIEYVPRWMWESGKAVTITSSMCASSHYYSRKRAGLPGRVPNREALEVMGIRQHMINREVANAVAPPMARYVAEVAIRQLGLGR